MDAQSYVMIGLALFGVVGSAAGWFIRTLRMDTNANASALNGRAKQEDFDNLKREFSDLRADVVHRDDFEEVKKDLSEFKLEANKSFVSNTAMMQVVSSLDRTLQQLTQAIQHNSQESRDGLTALNKRIDDLIVQRKA